MGDFHKWKAATFSKIDLSKKGSVDAEIEILVNYINGFPEYFTTSSCAGRIIICSDDPIVPPENGTDDSHPHNAVEASWVNKKRGCIWYEVSHTFLEVERALEALLTVEGCCKLKFEPLVLHVQCQTLQDAQTIHEAAVAAGFRNSGISLRKGERKIIAAVRGSSSLEVPLTNLEGERLTSDQYIGYIVHLANQKLAQNIKRIKTFEDKLKSLLEKSSDSVGTIPSNKTVYRRKRKAGQAPKDEKEPAEEDSDVIMDSCGLFNEES